MILLVASEQDIRIGSSIGTKDANPYTRKHCHVSRRWRRIIMCDSRFWRLFSADLTSVSQKYSSSLDAWATRTNRRLALSGSCPLRLQLTNYNYNRSPAGGDPELLRAVLAPFLTQQDRLETVDCYLLNTSEVSLLYPNLFSVRDLSIVDCPGSVVYLGVTSSDSHIQKVEPRLKTARVPSAIFVALPTLFVNVEELTLEPIHSEQTVYIERYPHLTSLTLGGIAGDSTEIVIRGSTSRSLVSLVLVNSPMEHLARLIPGFFAPKLTSFEWRLSGRVRSEAFGDGLRLVAAKWPNLASLSVEVWSKNSGKRLSTVLSELPVLTDIRVSFIIKDESDAGAIMSLSHVLRALGAYYAQGNNTENDAKWACPLLHSFTADRLGWVNFDADTIGLIFSLVYRRATTDGVTPLHTFHTDIERVPPLFWPRLGLYVHNVVDLGLPYR